MAGFLDAARQILEEAGEPLHGLEIVKRGRERNLFTSRAKDDWALVRTITSDVKRGNNSRHMVILGKGYYGLEDWGVSRGNPPVTEAPRAATITSTNNGCATGYHFGEAGAHPSGHDRR